MENDDWVYEEELNENADWLVGPLEKSVTFLYFQKVIFLACF